MDQINTDAFVVTCQSLRKDTGNYSNENCYSITSCDAKETQKCRCSVALCEHENLCGKWKWVTVCVCVCSRMRRKQNLVLFVDYQRAQHDKDFLIRHWAEGNPCIANSPVPPKAFVPQNKSLVLQTHTHTQTRRRGNRERRGISSKINRREVLQMEWVGHRSKTAKTWRIF